MRGVLGLCVSDGAVHGVVVDKAQVRWAGTTVWSRSEDGPALVDVVAQLAVDGARGVRTTRVVLSRDLVQLRTIDPAPPIRAHRAADYVRLAAPRLFRRNGSPLVTDASMAGRPGNATLRAAAAAEDVIAAVLAGCAQAGLEVTSVGPASDVLAAGTTGPATGTMVFPNGSTSEHLEVIAGRVTRSRRVLGVGAGTVQWVPALAALGERASAFAPAYAAALTRPGLELWPDGVRARRSRSAHRRLVATWLLALGCWASAGVIHVTRLLASEHRAQAELAALRPQVDSALAVRRELSKATSALGTLNGAVRHRSRDLPLVEGITRALDDSTTIVSLRITDTVVSLSGYAPLAARARAQLERVSGLDRVRFDGPVVRETVGDAGARRDLDRFALWAHRRGTP